MTTSLVGAVAGPVSTALEGGSPTPPNTGDGAEFSIGHLSFRLAISDERPYERATAQFRKEQFDTAPVYGDQSLTGLWTRGQFSFHKGAGVRYYETLDGETVLNRFRESEGVDPFEPGEVTLNPDWTATTASFVAPSFAEAGNGFYVVLDGTTLKYAASLTGGSTTYTPTAGTVQAATVGPLCAYVGTTSAKIERVGIASGAPATAAIYTHSATFQKVFYAKDRLWAFDGTSWYTLSPNPSGVLPVAVAPANLVFTAGDSWDTTWAFTDTPGAVLFANGSRVYAVALDASGAVPALAGPVQVAELPTGEKVVGMAHHLGFLVLNTTTGVRVGVVSDDGGVTYGPLLKEWQPDSLSSTTMARRGSSVYVAEGSATPALYRVDLSQQIGDGLEFAWAKVANPFTQAATTRAGAFLFGSTLVAWQGDGTTKHESGDLAATGALTTGSHRFGTLEPKKFQSVRVRVGGEGGTVAVSKVLADDSSVSLLTMDVTQTDGEVITLRTTAPVEAVGLRFTLTRDGADPTRGPVLLGYQLKAMPAPQRHRMIRVPLKLYDVERSKATPAVGYDGSAWDRLEALENMERSGASYVFQDFRTGEAGECFIEQIEHRGTTATGPNNSGFGGVVWVTLRKL